MAGDTPLPIINGEPLLTVLFPLSNVPPLKVKTLFAPLVTASWSARIFPLLNTSAPWPSPPTCSSASDVPLVTTRLPPVTVRTLFEEPANAPTQPSNVQAFSYGDLEMQVWWSASTDAVTPQNVIVYEIYVNGVHENTAIGTNMTPSAYGVVGDNEITVIAIDEAGNRSTAGRTTLFIP